VPVIRPYRARDRYEGEEHPPSRSVRWRKGAARVPRRVRHVRTSLGFYAATLCNYPACCGKSVRTFDSSPLRWGSPSSRFSLSQSGIAYADPRGGYDGGSRVRSLPPTVLQRIIIRREGP